MSALYRGLGAVTLALATGCSAAEHTTDPTPSETTFRAGILSGALRGPIGPTQTTNSAQITLTGITGDFTRLGILGADVGTGASAVYFSTPDSGGIPHIWRVNLDGSGLQQLTTGASGQVFPSISHAGDRLVFRDLGLSGGQSSHTDLWEWTAAAGARFLASETGATGIAAWLPGDTAIVYAVGTSAGDSGLRQRNLSGGPVTHLTEEPDSRVTAGLVGGVPTAYFTRRDSLYRINLTTRDTSYFYAPEPPFEAFSPDLSPDGQQLLFLTEFIRDFSLYSIRTDLSDTIQERAVLNPRGVGPFRPEAHWSGDTAFVWIELEAGGTAPQLLLLLSRVNNRRLTNFPAGVQNEFTVGPFLLPRPRILIGDGAELGSRASGIIYGLNGSGGLSALVTFESDDADGVSLVANTGLNSVSAVLTYTLTAERLRTLRFINGPEGNPVTVLDSTSPAAGGAFISFDAATGAVTTVLPFGGPGASRAPERSQ